MRCRPNQTNPVETTEQDWKKKTAEAARNVTSQKHLVANKSVFS